MIKDVETNGLLLPPEQASLDIPADPRDADKGRLVLFCRTDDEPPYYVLESHELAGDQPPWRRLIDGQYASISRRMMTRSPRFLPLIEYDLESSDEAVRLKQANVLGASASTNLSKPRLVLLDKVNGRPLCDPGGDPIPPFRFPYQGEGMTEFRSCLISDVIVLDDRVLAIAPDRYYILKRGSAEADED